jgi:uncharacterized protein
MTGIPEPPKARPRNSPSQFHVLAKPTGAICNLDCKYCFFLSKDALYAVTHDMGNVFIQLFESELASWAGLPASLCIFGETCGNALALEHNGDLYSCDHLVEPGFRLGNIREEHLVQLAASDQQRAFSNAKRDTLPRYCRECEVRFACNGECPLNRSLQTPDGEDGLNYLCAGYRAFFNHVDRPMKIMADLLRNGRDAADVMHIFQSEIVRN